MDKNIYLLLFSLVIIALYLFDLHVESVLNPSQLWAFNLATTIVLWFFLFSWCVEHAKHHNVNRPSALLIVLTGPLGLIIYFFNNFGLKGGLANTGKATSFLALVLVFAILIDELLIHLGWL